ncbi:MAG: hypothetical protein DCC71_21365 [Proteobacteria bacterium]|nr:MAG: hypothetical protein DCC71_21365 [Pseudomonadota bacterium]
MTTPDAPARFVDLERYPILDLDAPPARTLVGRARAQLAASGACELPGFLTRDATARMAAESDALIGRGHFAETRATVYLGLPEAGLPPGHPRARLGGRSAVEAIAYDLVPPAHALRQLYEWDGLVAFVAAALGKEKLYRYADPLGALNVASMQAGDELHWHFDQTDFVVSIALRDAEAGGDFEYAPRIRSRDDERYDDVARVLDGDRTQVRTIPLTPGTLLLFAGRDSLHRVTRVGGSVARLVALLAYDERPDTVSSELLRRARYGRNG